MGLAGQTTTKPKRAAHMQGYHLHHSLCIHTPPTVYSGSHVRMFIVMEQCIADSAYYRMMMLTCTHSFDLAKALGEIQLIHWTVSDAALNNHLEVGRYNKYLHVCIAH